MKKTLITIIALLFGIPQLYSQLKVDSTGTVVIGENCDHLVNPILKVGNGGILYSHGSNLFSTTIVGDSTSHEISGITGCVRSTNQASTARIAGVVGEAGGYSDRYCYGVVGALLNANNGAGIYGSSTPSPHKMIVNGRYAGYFKGDIYTIGNITATNFLSDSDLNLKENVMSLEDETEEESALSKIVNMNPVKFNYKKRNIEYDTEEDSMINDAESEAIRMEIEEAEKASKQLHFGLIAQELQTIYPNLVVERQDGMLAINYVELVPVLIQSIKELKQEINEMKGEGQIAKAPTATAITSATAEGKTSALYQNTPNPFNGQTTIRFQIANGAHSAYICIFDMQGKQLERHDLTTTDDSLTIDGTQLGAGMYLYTLIVDGREIDTKRMILSK